ncbi:MAG: hypothetical protein R3D52_11885 [Xanthobacteraceae bacterium]
MKFTPVWLKEHLDTDASREHSVAIVLAGELPPLEGECRFERAEVGCCRLPRSKMPISGSPEIGGEPGGV